MERASTGNGLIMPVSISGPVFAYARLKGVQMNERQEDLRDALRRMYGLDVTHLESVAIPEASQTVVEVFAIHGHPYAVKVYGWTYETEGEIQYLSALHQLGARSPFEAIKTVGLKLDP